MITAKYYWRELTDDGLLKPIKGARRSDDFLDMGFDTEEEALEYYSARFDTGGPYAYISNKFLLVKLYGIE